MATVSLLLKITKQTPPGKSVPIYIRLQDTIHLDIMAKTKYSIVHEEWNKAKQQPKSLKTEYYKNLNTDLQDLKTELLRHYNNNGNLFVNIVWLKDFLNPVEKTTEPEKPLGLIAYFTDYIAQREPHLSPNTVKKYNVIKNKLIRYQEALKREILIKDIDTTFQQSFEQYAKKHGYAKNTITMEVRTIRDLAKRAGRAGHEISRDIENIHNTYEKTTNIYLSFEEIERIKKPKLSPYLQNARDWIIISCFTGQRVSDFMTFTADKIRKEKNRSGKVVNLIEFQQKKTGKIMTLPLNDEVMEVINRLGGFPHVISETKYNSYVKLICKRAGLVAKVKGAKKVKIGKDKNGANIFRKEMGLYPKHELVSSHIGRRSFATNYYGKIPTSLLIAATGHGTEQMFLKYIGKSSSDRAMELADWF